MGCDHINLSKQEASQERAVRENYRLGYFLAQDSYIRSEFKGFKRYEGCESNNFLYSFEFMLK